MPSRGFPILIFAAVLLLLAATSMFTVGEQQLAIRTQFGAILGQNYAPGLHFKWPVDQVVKFERRILSKSYTSETFLTNDNRGLIVDFYVKWRVLNPSTYFQATGGREELASDRLAEIVKDGIKTVVAQSTLGDIVSSDRRKTTGEMLAAARASAEENLGIYLLDVRIQKIDLPEEVATRVYESMKQNFAKIASALRAEGSKAAVAIRAQAEKKRTETIAAAESKALTVRGGADAEAALIYTKAYSRDPEFYQFYRSLQAYERSLGRDGDVLVVTPDGEFFKYLKDSGKK